jgi:hypothetical protein
LVVPGFDYFDSSALLRQLPLHYIYSKTDNITEYPFLNKWVERQKKEVNASDSSSSSSQTKRTGPISALVFEDSPHVAHLRVHPTEYQASLKEFVLPLVAKVE